MLSHPLPHWGSVQEPNQQPLRKLSCCSYTLSGFCSTSASLRLNTMFV